MHPSAGVDKFFGGGGPILTMVGLAALRLPVPVRSSLSACRRVLSTRCHGVPPRGRVEGPLLISQCDLRIPFRPRDLGL